VRRWESVRLGRISSFQWFQFSGGQVSPLGEEEVWKMKTLFLQYSLMKENLESTALAVDGKFQKIQTLMNFILSLYIIYI